MSKKASKTMAIKSTINKSALSKSSAGKSSTGKKMEVGKSKTTDNNQRPTVSVKEAFDGNSGFSGLPPPPLEQTAKDEITDAQRVAIKELSGRIKERLDAWYSLKEQLAEFEPKEINDQRQPPPMPKYDESNFVSTRIALHDYLDKLGVEVEKMKNELKQFKLMAKEKAPLPKKTDDAPKSVQISTRKPVKKQRPWAIILAIGIGLVAVVVVAVVLGVVLGSKSDDVKTRASKSVTSEPAPDGQTGEASTNNGKSGGQGGGNTAPITTSSTAMSTTTTMPPPVNDYEIACKPQAGVSEECLVGSAPGSCSDGAVCWQMKFEVIGINIDERIYKFTIDNVDHTFPPPPINQKRMCKTDDGQLGSCDTSDECSPDGGLIDKGLSDRAEWKDNCDEPSPCWEGWAIPHSVELERKHCNQGSCAAYKHAAIWIQHMRCYAGNGQTANGTCQGLPLRLWVCGNCSYHVDHLKSHACAGGQVKPVADGCTLECRRRSVNIVAAPDGFACNFTDPADGQKPGHCYKGQCFPIAKDARIDPIPTLAECNQTREADKKIQAEFMRGRRGAIDINDFSARINARTMPDDEPPKVASEKPTEFPIKLEDDKKKPFDE